MIYHRYTMIYHRYIIYFYGQYSGLWLRYGVCEGYKTLNRCLCPARSCCWMSLLWIIDFSIFIPSLMDINIQHVYLCIYIYLCTCLFFYKWMCNWWYLTRSYQHISSLTKTSNQRVFGMNPFLAGLGGKKIASLHLAVSFLAAAAVIWRWQWNQLVDPFGVVVAKKNKRRRSTSS